MMGGNLVLVEGAVAQLIPLGPSTPKKSKFDHIAICSTNLKGILVLPGLLYTQSNALITIRLFLDC